jgi:D-3-phosphoglycerate dehydrogenase
MHNKIESYRSIFEKYEISFDVPDVDQQLTEEELTEIIEPYHGVVAGDDEFTAEVLDKALNLEVISKWGIGTDNIDQTAAADRDITVYNTPGMFNEEVADVVIGYAIMLTRDLHHIDRAVRAGDWVCPRGTSLSGKTFGVIGVGDIGTEVARRAATLGMDVLGQDVRPIPEKLRKDTGIEATDRRDLLERSDIVSLNCPLTPDTRKMIGPSALEHIGSNGYLINASRGELIEQGALVEALQSGIVAGAALDVFETEPLPKTNPLTEMDNVILGSHNAQNTVEAVERTNQAAIKNLLRGLGLLDDNN